MASVTAEVTDLCPYCGDVDPWINTHHPWFSEGRFSNGHPEFTPACTCGHVFQGTATADTARTAKSLAGRQAHPFSEKIYCPDPWHQLHPVEEIS